MRDRQLDLPEIPRQEFHPIGLEDAVTIDFIFNNQRTSAGSFICPTCGAEFSRTGQAIHNHALTCQSVRDAAQLNFIADAFDIVVPRS